MDHSVQGYLERRSTKALEGILLYLQEHGEEYEAEMAMVLQILAKRQQQEEENCQEL